MDALRTNVRARRYLRWHIRVWAPSRVTVRSLRRWRMVTVQHRFQVRRHLFTWRSATLARQLCRRVVTAWLKRFASLHTYYGFHRWVVASRRAARAEAAAVAAAVKQARLRAVLHRIVAASTVRSIGMAFIRWRCNVEEVVAQEAAAEVAAAATPVSLTPTPLPPAGTPSPSTSFGTGRYSLWRGTTLHAVLLRRELRAACAQWRRGAALCRRVVATTPQHCECCANRTGSAQLVTAASHGDAVPLAQAPASVALPLRPRKARPNPTAAPVQSAHPFGTWSASASWRYVAVRTPRPVIEVVPPQSMSVTGHSRRSFRHGL
jgi:hypothetical protein